MVPYDELFAHCSFGRIGYIENVVCQYHFAITELTTVVFDKLHLDRGYNDPTGGMVSFEECKDASQELRRDRDYIALNVMFEKGESNVFCGHYNGKVIRTIQPQHLQSPNSELIITFWSDSAHTGEGFSGYLYRGDAKLLRGV